MCRHCSGLGWISRDGPRGVRIVLPVHDPQFAARSERAKGFLQQSLRLLDVEDVEKHGVAGAPVRQTGASGQEITLDDLHVFQVRYERMSAWVVSIMIGSRSRANTLPETDRAAAYRERSIAAAELDQ